VPQEGRRLPSGDAGLLYGRVVVDQSVIKIRPVHRDSGEPLRIVSGDAVIVSAVRDRAANDLHGVFRGSGVVVVLVEVRNAVGDVEAVLRRRLVPIAHVGASWK